MFIERIERRFNFVEIEISIQRGLLQHLIMKVEEIVSSSWKRQDEQIEVITLRSRKEY